MKYLWQRICFGRTRSCLHRSNNFIYSSLQSCIWLFIQVVTNTCSSPVTNASCERSFS